MLQVIRIDSDIDVALQIDGVVFPPMVTPVNDWGEVDGWSPILDVTLMFPANSMLLSLPIMLIPVPPWKVPPRHAPE